MEDPIEKYFSYQTYAVAGASRRKDKFGYKVLQDLIARGKTVIPVNPGASEIDGLTCYSSITDIPSEIDAVHFITRPEVTEKLAKECIARKVKAVWMQPGAESDRAVDELKAAGIDVIYQMCVFKS